MTLFAGLLLCLLGSLLSSSWAEVPQGKPQARSRCPFGTYAYKDGVRWFCYEFYEYLVPFEEAEAICQDNRNGGHLASITSEEQTRMLGGYLTRVNGARDRVWIGLNWLQNSNSWQWTDETAFRYNSWLGQAPINTGKQRLCATLTPGSGYKYWNAVTCEVNRPFLCKWRAR